MTESVITIAMNEQLFNELRHWANSKGLIVRPLAEAAYLLSPPSPQPPHVIHDGGGLWKK